MRDKHIRDVTFVDVKITSPLSYAPIKPFQYFLDKLAPIYTAKQTTRTNRLGTEKIFIRDMRINHAQKYVALLIEFTSGDAAATSYSHMITTNHRKVPPGPDEGRPETAHVIIGLTPEEGTLANHRAVIEDCIKLSRNKIQTYFSFLFREIKRANPDDFREAHPDGSTKPDGTPRTYSYTNTCEIQGVPSQEFKKMLKEGKLTGIWLETYNKEKFAFGEGSQLTPSRQELKLVPTQGRWNEDAMSKLVDALGMGETNGFERARISFIAEDNRPATATLDTKTGHIIGDAFTKKKRLSGFSQWLDESDTSINDEVLAKMLTVFSQ